MTKQYDIERDGSEEQRSQTVAMAVRGLQIFLITAAILLVFNSAKLRSAVRDFPANAVTDRMVLAADQWHAWMEAAGAAKVAETLHQAMLDIRDTQWPE